MTLPEDFDVQDFIQRVLAEDLGKGGDVTSAATIDANAQFTAEMNARQAISVAGIELAAALFRALDLRIPLHSISRSGSIRSRVPKDPIKIGAERRVWGVGQGAGRGSGWGLRPFWRRREEPRSDRTCELCTSRSQMASAIVGSPRASCQLFV